MRHPTPVGEPTPVWWRCKPGIIRQVRNSSVLAFLTWFTWGLIRIVRLVLRRAIEATRLLAVARDISSWFVGIIVRLLCRAALALGLLAITRDIEGRQTRISTLCHTITATVAILTNRAIVRATAAVRLRAAMPTRLDHANARVGLDHRAVGTHGSQSDRDELLEVVIERIHLDLRAGGVAIDVRHLQGSWRIEAGAGRLDGNDHLRLHAIGRRHRHLRCVDRSDRHITLAIAIREGDRIFLHREFEAGQAGDRYDLVFLADPDRSLRIELDHVDRGRQGIVGTGYGDQVIWQARPFAGHRGGAAVGDQMYRAYWYFGDLELPLNVGLRFSIGTFDAYRDLG